METDGFSGAEIEETVVSALYRAFYEDVDINDKFIQKAIKETTPLSVSASPQLEAMKKWAEKNAVNATKLTGKLEQALGRQIEI